MWTGYKEIFAWLKEGLVNCIVQKSTQQIFEIIYVKYVLINMWIYFRIIQIMRTWKKLKVKLKRSVIGGTVE